MLWLDGRIQDEAMKTIRISVRAHSSDRVVSRVHREDHLPQEGTMYIQDRTNLSPRARIVSNDIKDDLRLRSASTALEAITSRLASLGGDAKVAARKRQQSASDAMLFKVKQDILMNNPFLFRTFKERVVASKVHAPILVHGVLLEFFADLKIPDIQHELKQEALARTSLPVDNDLRDHFTSTFSSLETASKRLRDNRASKQDHNKSDTVTKSTTPTATVTSTAAAASELSTIKEDMRISPAGKQNISPLGTFTKTVIEDPMDENFDSSDDEDSVSDSDSDEEDSVSESSSDEESIVSASSYASFMSESGESQESERLEV